LRATNMTSKAFICDRDTKRTVKVVEEKISFDSFEDLFGTDIFNASTVNILAAYPYIRLDIQKAVVYLWLEFVLEKCKNLQRLDLISKWEKKEGRNARPFFQQDVTNAARDMGYKLYGAPKFTFTDNSSLHDRCIIVYNKQTNAKPETMVKFVMGKGFGFFTHIRMCPHKLCTSHEGYFDCQSTRTPHNPPTGACKENCRSRRCVQHKATCANIDKHKCWMTGCLYNSSISSFVAHNTTMVKVVWNQNDLTKKDEPKDLMTCHGLFLQYVTYLKKNLVTKEFKKYSEVDANKI